MAPSAMRHTPLHGIVLMLLAAWLPSVSSQAQLITALTPVDIGAPPLPGTTTINSPGAITVQGSGEYKNSGSDNFHFAYTNVTADFDYQVRVEQMDVPSQWCKAGLMARETTDESVTADLGCRAISMNAYPPPPAGGNTFILVRREQADTPTADDILGTTPAYPNAWMRLRRLGNTLIGYTGTNGVNWDVQGVRDTATWPDGPLSPNLLLGIAVASANNTKTVTAQLREFGRTPSDRPLAIAVPLKPATVNKAKAAKFSITVSGYDPYSARWYRNGLLIGETNSFSSTMSYTTGPLSLADDNTTFSVVVSNAAGSVTNANVAVRVLDDSAAPVVTAATTDNGFIDVLFNEEVSETTALTAANYTLKGTTAVPVDVTLSSNQRVATLALNTPVTETNATLTVARVQDLVGNTRTQTVPLWQMLPPDNIVASGYPNERESAFTSVTDTVIDSGWQTTGDRDHRPQFAGLTYSNAQTFAVVKMDLGEQNEFGGSFTEQPKLYLLRNNVDTDVTGPETDSANWTEVAAPLVSPNLFDGNVDANPSPASPIIFDLTALSPGARAGYGWAIGGVRGDNSGFIRVSELRAYGQSGGDIEVTPAMSVARTTVNTIMISWPATASDFVLKTTTSLGSPTWSPVTEPTAVTGANVTVTVDTSSGTRFYRLER
jgi:hypothetical protein